MKLVRKPIDWRVAKALAIGFGPIMLAVLFLVSATVSYWTELDGQADAYRLQIAKVGWIAANAPKLRSEVAAATAPQDKAAAAASGSDDELAASLQSSVKGWLDQSSLQISSIQPLSISDENGLHFVSVQAQAKGSYQNVVALLRAYRQSTPRTLITAFDLMSDGTQPPPGTAGSAAPDPAYNLDAEFSYAVAKP